MCFCFLSGYISSCFLLLFLSFFVFISVNELNERNELNIYGCMSSALFYPCFLLTKGASWRSGQCIALYGTQILEEQDEESSLIRRHVQIFN